jgi:hypothetical protein
VPKRFRREDARPARSTTAARSLTCAALASHKVASSISVVRVEGDPDLALGFLSIGVADCRFRRALTRRYALVRVDPIIGEPKEG